MPKEFDLDKILLEARQQSIARTQRELIEKKVELGQVRKFSVDRGHSLCELNGAEIKVTSIDQESGAVGFELTDNNDPAVLEKAKSIANKEADIMSLFKPIDITLEEKFRETIKQRKIEIGKVYKNKKALLPLGKEVTVCDIDYTNQWINGKFSMFGATSQALFEIEEIGEEM
jgi:hypothetical protein